MRPIAQAHDCGPARIALAWLLAKPAVTAIPIGVKRRDQLADNIAAIDVNCDRTFENGDQVVLTVHFKHCILGTGKECESDFAAICRVRDGKVSTSNFIEDSFALWQSFQHT